MPGKRWRSWLASLGDRRTAARSFAPAARRRLSPAVHSLLRTGDLGRSLTERGAPYGGQELRDGGKTLELSTGAPGAVEAQFGTSREPARPIVPDDVPDELLEEIADRIGDYILEGLL